MDEREFGRKIDEVKVPTSFRHPPYSADLAPSDYYLFPNMKKWLAGRFYLNEEVIAETNAYFAELDQTYYSEGINKLEQWTKCISLKGAYVEK